MKQFAPFDQRPLLVAIAGPNGAGKTTFYHAHLESAGLRFINADVLARELNFETVFSDSARDKLGFLKEAVQSGYTVALCYIGLASPEISGERVAMRVSQGGHDVPAGKLKSRSAIRELPHVLVYDNSDLRHPFRRIAVFHNGRPVYRSKRVPKWFNRIDS